MSPLRRFLPHPIRRGARQYIWCLKRHARGLFRLPPEEAVISFAQEGEDLVLARAIEMSPSRPAGFYVDIGAHHPLKISNTYYFYLRNWRGINIDPLPGSMAAFRSARPRDVNLELAISDSQGDQTYYEFNAPALNGFDRELAMSRDGHNGMRIISTKTVKTRTLSEVLDEYLPKNQSIDFLNVDVEGHDLNVLRSNDWTKYRPRVVLVEDTNITILDDILQAPVGKFLIEKGYVPFAKTALTVFFADADSIHRTQLGLRIDLSKPSMIT